MSLLTTLYRLRDGVETCYYVRHNQPLSANEQKLLKWLVTETFEQEKTSGSSFLNGNPLVEIGPRLNVETPFSSNAVSIFRAAGSENITRVERSIRRLVTITATEEAIIRDHLDHMTHTVYPTPLAGFDLAIDPAPVRRIPVLEEGAEALRRVNKELGLGFDDHDIETYMKYFQEVEGRNPSDVELFQIANGNSEHCRHHYFKGIQEIDGIKMSRSLLEVIRGPLLAFGHKTITLKGFNDNTGVSRGGSTTALLPMHPGRPSRLVTKVGVWHITCTAETHNHPTRIAPFPGANTGTGGELRDEAACGKGSIPRIGVAGYCTGNLHITGYDIPGGGLGKESVRQYATPLEILLKGSDGIAAYSNEFGHPCLGGFTRTFGQNVRGERREFEKPILYAGGMGVIYDGHLHKSKPEKGMLVIRMGGPAYRIGVGGGSASSMAHGNTAALDFASVQRGNAEMGNRVVRVIKTCVALLEENPIESIHDQGAGGPSNVLTELIDPAGAVLNIRSINVADPTMSTLEIWSAEFQEGFGVLVRPENLKRFKEICSRERVNCEVMGSITGDGRIIVEDSKDGSIPVDLSLKHIMSETGRKTWKSTRVLRVNQSIRLPDDLTVTQAQEMVFKQLSVGSKGFLVHKKDRSVTGLVAAQQCCGPAQIAVGNVQVMALGYTDMCGAASAIGEQPIKMLVNPAAGARMALGESLTNLCAAKVSQLEDVRYRANWMWAAKLAGEGSQMWDAAVAVTDMQTSLGVANDGGKDSLSMSVKLDGETVKSPGSLVMYGYAPVPDIRMVVTPDFKGCEGESLIGFIDLGKGKNRLGGSALAQALGQIGDESPDVEDRDLLKRAFNAIQALIGYKSILAYHDRSDGGLMTTLAEMCMAGNCGANISLDGSDPVKILFNEELGMVFEYWPHLNMEISEVMDLFNVPWKKIGSVVAEQKLNIRVGGELVCSKELLQLRREWEETSYQLERLQANPKTAEQERNSRWLTESPMYRISFEPKKTPPSHLMATDKPRVAILREEGSNGEAEMAAAFHAAGFEAWDVNMYDLLVGTATLDDFQGVAFVGGFSFMDVFDSAKGWAAIIKFTHLAEMFDRFYHRPDTFSLGVCNGCQLMALLGWVPGKGLSETVQPRFVRNESGRFESRWTQITIGESPSILFRGMGGSTFGVHVAHGEGRLVFPDSSVLDTVRRYKVAPLYYADPQGNPTEDYPQNPNGSSSGMAGLCSVDGRHTAMMPHPERCFVKSQWPWMPPSWKTTKRASPWLKMFQNARDWCLENRA